MDENRNADSKISYRTHIDVNEGITKIVKSYTCYVELKYRPWVCYIRYETLHVWKKTQWVLSNCQQKKKTENTIHEKYSGDEDRFSCSKKNIIMNNELLTIWLSRRRRILTGIRFLWVSHTNSWVMARMKSVHDKNKMKRWEWETRRKMNFQASITTTS